eukprot:TRINITY_DN8075_c1_g4_i1.p1 TRINITY_DN8075_c1_g4~~TRINITY_DN8075_c1_g4_i1.p1  ORF type:complete len:366 (-),score=73.41 TRINITY_DN8075_c1_g4_i1:156-1202(-)
MANVSLASLLFSRASQLAAIATDDFAPVDSSDLFAPADEQSHEELPTIPPELANPAPLIDVPATSAAGDVVPSMISMRLIPNELLGQILTIAPCDPPLLEIMLQPRAQISKGVLFDTQIRLNISIPPAPAMYVALVYADDHSLVQKNVLGAVYAIRDNVCFVRARVNELSKAHSNRAFRLLYAMTTSEHIASVVSEPFKVLSKSFLLQSEHRAKRTRTAGADCEPKRVRSNPPAASDSAVRPPQAFVPSTSSGGGGGGGAGGGGFSEDSDSADLSVDELRAMYLQSEQRLQDIEQQTSAEMAELREHVALLSEQVRVLQQVLEQAAPVLRLRNGPGAAFDDGHSGTAA